MGERLKLNQSSGTGITFDCNIVKPFDELKITFAPKQSDSGTPSPSNVRAITGWTGINVLRANSNLFDATVKVENIKLNGGSVVADNDYNVYYVPVEQNTTYKIYHPYYDETYYYGFDSEVPHTSHAINGYGIMSATQHSVSTGNNTYILISLKKTIDVSGVVVMEGSATSVTVSFPQEAGTVYGGYVDLVKKQLIITHTQVDKSNYTLEYNNSGQYYLAVIDTDLYLRDISNQPNSSIGAYSALSAHYTWFMTSGEKIKYRFDTQDTEEQILSIMNNFQLVLKLKNPIVYNLVNCPDILPLLGHNTLWSNANGEIEAKWYDEDLVHPANARNLTLENCKEGPIDSFIVDGHMNYYQSGTPTPTNESFYYEITDIGFTIGSFENEVPLIPDNYTPITASGATLNYLGDDVYFLEGTTTNFQAYDVSLKPFTFNINKKYIGRLEILNREQSKVLFTISVADSNNIGAVATWTNLKTNMKSTFLINLSSSMLINLKLRVGVFTGNSNIKFKFKIFEVDPNRIYSSDISAISKPIYHFSYDALTGVLTLPRKTKTLIADDLIEVGTSDSGVQYAITTDIPDIKPNSEVTGNRHYWENPGNNNTMKSENKHVIIYDNRFTDLATAKELIEGTIIYYYLDTPETYQLESYPVTLQEGTNVFFGNDTHSQLSVKYREEIKDSILSLRRRSFAWDYKTYIASHPAVLQKLCSTGKASNYFKIGDEIIIPWTDNGGDTPIEYQYPFVVTHFGDVYDENGNLHENGMWLMAKYATPREIIFDAAESTIVNLIEEPNALEGWYYWGVDGYDYTELRLNTGDVIPTTHASVVKCGINEVNALRYGYDRWKDSAYRQWLNSDAAKNEGWWTEQHMGDRPPAAAQLNLPGWLDGFTDEWKAIFKPVKVDTACNIVTDGGVTDTTYDTFFLPSLEQMYGAPQAAGVEGDYWEYWKEETGLDAPTNGSSSNTNDARKIPSIANPTGSAVYCRLRSANRDHAYKAWNVYTAGYLNHTIASYSCRALPACVIY